MNYEKNCNIATPRHGFGVHSRGNGSCPLYGSEVYGKWCNRLLRVAGWCKGVSLRGLCRPDAAKPARPGDGIHSRSELAGKGWIHTVSAIAVCVLMLAAAVPHLPHYVRMALVVPLGLFASWCLFVSFVRIMQSVTGCAGFKELLEELKDTENV